MSWEEAMMQMEATARHQCPSYGTNQTMGYWPTPRVGARRLVAPWCGVRSLTLVACASLMGQLYVGGSWQKRWRPSPLLSALAMFISPIFEKGKFLASITVVLSLTAFILSPIESIQQTGGMALVIVAVMCAMIQYHINQGCHKKYFNGFGGGITFVLLLTMYPEGGVKETIHTFTFTENLLAIIESIIIGVLLAQLLHNSYSFNEKNSAGIIITLAILSIGSDLLDSGDLLVVIISMLFVGFLPFLEDKISPKIGSGNGRANALAISTLIGIILIFATTYALVSNVNRIGDGSGAIAVSLWLTVAVTSLGLIGMLLPLLGFDAHPRPEAWGWRFGISISPMIICLQTDLTSNILLGISLALLISISSPLVLEKGSRKAA